MSGEDRTMGLAESSRRLLYASAAEALGTEAADVLMEHLPPAGWADLARRSDVEHETELLRTEMRGEFAAIRAEMAAMRAELGGRIHEASASQTRWMVSMFALLGALYTTVTMLGH
jgi:hypothetical protein